MVKLQYMETSYQIEFEINVHDKLTELNRQKWSYWDLWQAKPFMATKQVMT